MRRWDGEEFFVQIDGHSDFLQDWDEHLLHNLAALPRKSIITHYPTGDALGLGMTENTPWYAFRPNRILKKYII